MEASTASWQRLHDHRDANRDFDLRRAFSDNPSRADDFTVRAGALTIDFSKQLVDQQALILLLELAERSGLTARTEAMFTGERVNTTEDRSALHVALRAGPDGRFEVAGKDVMVDVHRVLHQMREFAVQIRTGMRLGATGRPIRNVVNIGIGGSHLGPNMAVEALRQFVDPDLTVRFVSNVDGADLADAISALDPAETLFIVASKTFTTAETLTNAISARRWVTDALGEDATSHHFVAVSTNVQEVENFGIDSANVFEFWDWVGGRLSLPSSIGLALMVAIGPESFDDLLSGFRDIDEHFRTAPPDKNAPILLGLIGIWNINVLGCTAKAVIPYSHRLSKLPAYLQQLDMESNGKSVDVDGNRVGMDTAPVVWGTPGTNGQHAYFQLLHQGTSVVPIDLIGFVKPSHDLPGHHDQLMANMFAQAEALAFGRTEDEVRAAGVSEPQVPHRTFSGNRPTTSVLAPDLNPRTLGQVIALYEHTVFVQGTVWRINSFDQWGVELGKQLAGEIVGQIGDEVVGAHDSSTNALISEYLKGRTT